MPRPLLPDIIWLVTSTTNYGSWRGIVKGDKFGIPHSVLERGIPALRKFLRDRRINAYMFRIDGVRHSFSGLSKGKTPVKLDFSDAKYIDVFGPYTKTSTRNSGELLLELQRAVENDFR